MNEKNPIFVAVPESIIEANILFEKLRIAFTGQGIDSHDEDLLHSLAYEGRTPTDQINIIHKEILHTFEYIYKRMPEPSTYYSLYGAFTGFLEKHAIKSKKELYQIIIVTYLLVVATTSQVTDAEILGMNNLGALDNLANWTVRAGLDAYSFILNKKGEN